MISETTSASLLAKKTTYKARKNSVYYLNVNVNGNKKLVNNDKVRWIIWNLPSIVTCPHATEHCKKSCYALKAEKVYPSAKVSRYTNYDDAQAHEIFADRMIFTLETELATKKFKGKLAIVRVHESGDFFSQEYANAWMKVVDYFKNRKEICFMWYTKSLPFFRNFDIKSYENLSFIASVWDDTSAEMLEEIKQKNYRIYTAVNSFNDYKGYKCRCKDCATCRGCINNKVSEIACEIH